MCNGNILIKNEVITRRDCLRNKIFNVNSFMKENNKPLTLREFSSKFNIRLDFLTYHGLIRAIGRYKNPQGILMSSVGTVYNPHMHALLANKSGLSCIYPRIFNKSDSPPKKTTKKKQTNIQANKQTKGIKRWENNQYTVQSIQGLPSLNTLKKY